MLKKALLRKLKNNLMLEDIMKQYLLLSAVLLLVVLAPACRKTKQVEEPREEVIESFYEEVRVSGPEGWLRNLSEQDLK